jgi:hypothetical protein
VEKFGTIALSHQRDQLLNVYRTASLGTSLKNSANNKPAAQPNPNLRVCNHNRFFENIAET